MGHTIWAHVATLSPAVQSFSKHVSLEIARLKAKSADSLVLASHPCSAGPRCSTCGSQGFGLFRNAPCGHTACESCWSIHAHKQIPSCEAEEKLLPSCFGARCEHAISAGVWGHLRTFSMAVSKYADGRDAERSRLMRTAGDLLTWAPNPCEPGPLCCICKERHVTLLANTDCGHAACESCWSSWLAVQAPRCMDEKQVTIRCLGEKCRAAASGSLWRHACTRSEEVGGAERLLARRRQLQSNLLYPEAVQVDCPREGCIGLGYRGHDTIMCFICEHQWIDGTGEAPETNLSEVIAGELMKRCPKCEEYIIKNGGCDHMTCRCGHEFYWTTLK